MSMKNSNDTIWNRTSNLQICSAVPYLLCHRGPPILKLGRGKIQKNFQLGSESPIDAQTSMLGRSCEDRTTNDWRQADIITNILRLGADFNSKRTDHGRIDTNQIFPSSISRKERLIALFSTHSSPLQRAYSVAELLTKALDSTEVSSDQTQRMGGVRATVPGSVIVITVTNRQNMHRQDQGPTKAADHPQI
jgi:hypothetical protein